MRSINKFTIDRAKWRTGRYPDEDIKRGLSALKNEEGFKCCLGFYLTACGLRNLEGAQAPSCLGKEKKKVPAWLITKKTLDSNASGNLMGFNDDVGVPDNEREESVAEGFAKQGIKVIFKGKYPKL